MGFPHQCEFTRQGWKLDPWTCEFLPIIPFREPANCVLLRKLGPKSHPKNDQVPPEFRRSAVPPTQKRAPDKNGSPLTHVAGPATLNGCANRIRDEGTAHHLMDNGYGFVWKGCLLIHWFTIMFNKKHYFMVKKTSSDRPCMVIHPRMGMGNLPRSWPRNKWYFVWPLRCWSSKISANYA